MKCMAQVFGLRQQTSNSCGADGWLSRANRHHPEPSGPVLLSSLTRCQGEQAAVDFLSPWFLPSFLCLPPTVSALTQLHYLGLKGGTQQPSRKYSIISGEFQRLVKLIFFFLNCESLLPHCSQLLFFFHKPGFTYISFDDYKRNKMEAIQSHYWSM